MIKSLIATLTVFGCLIGGAQMQGTQGAGSGLLGGLTNGLMGQNSPLNGLTNQLGGGQPGSGPLGSLNGLTNGLMGPNSPLSGLTSQLGGSRGPLGNLNGMTSNLLGQNNPLNGLLGQNNPLSNMLNGGRQQMQQLQQQLPNGQSSNQMGGLMDMVGYIPRQAMRMVSNLTSNVRRMLSDTTNGMGRNNMMPRNPLNQMNGQQGNSMLPNVNELTQPISDAMNNGRLPDVNQMANRLSQTASNIVPGLTRTLSGAMNQGRQAASSAANQAA